MKTRRSNLPLLLLFLFPWAHIYAIGEALPSDQQSGFWSIGATAIFFLDIGMAGLLAYLFQARMRWKSRERMLLTLAALVVLFGGIFGGLETSRSALLILLAMNGIPLAVVVLGWIWVSRQRDMREM